VVDAAKNGLPRSLAPLHLPAQLNLTENSGKGLIMRKVCFVLLGALLASAPALAQQPAPATAPTMKPPAHQAPAAKGPSKPDVNAAYMGGGVILQAAPGQPAPIPEPTPPGQTPKNMVQP
jgi:hypothetical protein